MDIVRFNATTARPGQNGSGEGQAHTQGAIHGAGPYFQRFRDFGVGHPPSMMYSNYDLARYRQHYHGIATFFQQLGIEQTDDTDLVFDRRVLQPMRVEIERI